MLKSKRWPVAVSALAAMILAGGNALAQGVWDLPFKAENLAEGDRIYRGKAIHSDSGPQKYGYDVDIRRYRNGAWWGYRGDGKKNSDWYIYGKPVYAMAPGKVIACWRNAPENPPWGKHPELTKHGEPKTRIYGGGNGFWLLQDDGSIIEYAHFIPGTVPAHLCPHNAKLLPKVIDRPHVNWAWRYIRVTNGKRVRRGQRLGLAGNAGTSSNPHLHIHMEKGGNHGLSKSNGTSVPFRFRRGLYVKRNDAKGPWQTGWKSFAGQQIPPGPVLVWPPRTVKREYARFGFPAGKYTAMFQHLAESGYLPVIVDAYTVRGGDYINHVWRPARGRRFLAWHLLSGGDYQRAFTAATGRGFHPIWVDSALSRGQVRYSAVFVRGAPPGLARHGMTGPQLTAAMKLAVKQRRRAAQVSVVSIGGQLRFTALFNNAPIGGGWVVRPHIAETLYQKEYAAQAKAGRHPFYVHGYMHKGRRYISAIFGSRRVLPRRDRHGLTGRKFLFNYVSAIKGGLVTRAVGGYDGDNAHRFIASWFR